MDHRLVHGPYRSIQKAADDAYMLVDPPVTLWSVVELFGEGFSTMRPDGEEWGTLFVVPTDDAREFSEDRGADGYQIIDTYGYTEEEA